MAMQHKKVSRKQYCREVYGYDVNSDCNMVENPSEKEVGDLIVQLRQAGKSLRASAVTLTELGHETRRSGSQWVHTTIQSILKDDICQPA